MIDTTYPREIAVLGEEILAIYDRFLGLEEIYPRDKVSSASVINIKDVNVLTPKWNVPGVLVFPGGERLDVNKKGIATRLLGLGAFLVERYEPLDAIQRLSPASAAYAVLIQGRCLTIFEF